MSKRPSTWVEGPWIRRVIGAVSSIVPLNIADRLGIGVSSVNAECAVEVNGVGGLAMHGTTGGTPASGARTGLEWIPAKGSIRAGSCSGTEWDDANIGAESVALGRDCTASGANGVALGRFCRATAQEGFAAGYGNLASGARATAIGFSCQASSGNAVALGSSTASGAASFAAGQGSTASGTYAVAIGYQCTATQQGAVACGQSADATQTDAVAIGNNTTSDNTAAVAIGNNSTCHGAYAVALGGATCSSGGSYSLAWGNGAQSTAAGAVALGRFAQANGTDSCASGYQCYAYGEAAWASGRQSMAGRPGMWARSRAYLSAVGDAQIGTWDAKVGILAGNTGGIPTSNGLGASSTTTPSTSNRFVLEANRAYFLRGTAIARDSAGAVKAWTIEVVADKGSTPASVRIVGAATIAVKSGDGGAAAWSLTVSANIATGSIDFYLSAAPNFANDTHLEIRLDWPEVT